MPTSLSLHKTFCCLLCILLLRAAPPAGAARRPLLPPGSAFLPKTCLSESLTEQRYSSLVKQDSPSTCGQAAVITFLRHLYGIDPANAWQTMLASLRKTEERLNMLHIKQLIAACGLHPHAYRLNLSQLTTLSQHRPLILHLAGKRPHFTVLYAGDDRQLLLLDPSFGEIVVQPDAFLRRWSGITLCVEEPPVSSWQPAQRLEAYRKRQLFLASICRQSTLGP